MFDVATESSRYERRAARRLSTWTREYLRNAALADFGCAVVGVFIAAQIRFGNEVTSMLPGPEPGAAGALDRRIVAGRGLRCPVHRDRLRRIPQGAERRVSGLTAAIAIFSYAVNLQLSRAYVVIALPSVTLFDLVARYVLRKRLHKRRASGRCMQSVLAVGHELAVADLVTELRREPYHGLTVSVPAWRGPENATNSRACRSTEDWTTSRPRSRPSRRIPSRSSRVRKWTASGSAALAWELEKTGTDLCVAPSLLDVAGPRTTIRPTAGFTLLHVDHPELERLPPGA